MENKIILIPGDPNDDNRDYLPEAIKGSQMVVNENGNNSQPYPAGLIEYKEVITQDGLEDTLVKIEKLDLDTLNKAIKDLAAVVEPLAKFFNSFDR